MELEYFGAQDPADLSEEQLEQSYEALYQNIGHWVKQSKCITRVPCRSEFSDDEDCEFQHDF